MKKIFLATLLFSQLLQAKDFDFLLQSSFGMGGDTLIVNENNKKIKGAGDGLMYSVGTIFKTVETREDFHTALTIGWLFSWTSSTNDGSMFVSKFPLTLTQYFSIKQWQLGAGLTYHMRHKLYTPDAYPDVKFDNALGTVFSLGYALRKKHPIQIGIRTTFITYTPSGNIIAINNHKNLSGNRIALFVESVF